MPTTVSVFLNVHDIQRSLDFYRKLGFRVDREHRGENGRIHYADLSFQGAELGLGAIGSNDDLEFRAWVGTPLGAGVIVYFTVPGKVDDLFARAKEAGAVVEFPPTDRPYGRLFGINDPDGYVLQFIQEPRAAAPRRRPAAKAARKAAGKSGGKASKKRVAKKKAPAKKVKKAAAKKGGKARRARR